MSVSEREQAMLAHRERRMAIMIAANAALSTKGANHDIMILFCRIRRRDRIVYILKAGAAADRKYSIFLKAAFKNYNNLCNCSELTSKMLRISSVWRIRQIKFQNSLKNASILYLFLKFCLALNSYKFIMKEDKKHACKNWKK